MKLKALIGSIYIVATRKNYVAGDIFELNDKQALSMIESGAAVAVEEPKAEEATGYSVKATEATIGDVPVNVIGRKRK